MTALEQYIRLEAPGQWREHPEAPWREVLVSFGNATLVLSTFDEAPLTHWSLAAIERQGARAEAATYTPDGGTRELLSVRDADMIAAIEEVTRLARHGARTAAGRPAPRLRLRVVVLLAIAALIAGAAVFGPDLARDRALALVRPEQATLIAGRIRERLDVAPCTAPEGTAALRRLATRAVPGTPVDVMPWQAPSLAVLPDGSVLIARSVVERAGSAEVVAGWAAAGAAAGPPASVLARWIDGLSLPALARFLASGRIERPAIAAMAAELRRADTPPPPAAVARAAETLEEREIDPAPYLRAIGAPAPPADPGAHRPVLPRDRDWVALQNICEL